MGVHTTHESRFMYVTVQGPLHSIQTIQQVDRTVQSFIIRAHSRMGIWQGVL